MNIDLTLFGIAYIIGLIIPGVFFKRFYYLGHFRKQFRSGLFADRLLTSLFWGVVVQSITFFVFGSTFGLAGQEPLLPKLITKLKISTIALSELTWGALLSIQLYFLASISVAMGLGFLLHHLVRSLRIDLHFAILQFSNHWHYRLRGELAKSPGKKCFGSWVDLQLLHPTPEYNIIVGFVVDYDLDSNGELLHLVLDRAKKYDSKRKEYFKIPGHRFLIKMSEVRDVNFRYVYQSIGISELKRKLSRIILVAALLLLAYVLIFPWTYDVALYRKLLSVALNIIAWLGVTSIALNPFIRDKNSKLTTKQIILIGIVSLLVYTLGFYMLMH